MHAHPHQTHPKQNQIIIQDKWISARWICLCSNKQSQLWIGSSRSTVKRYIIKTTEKKLLLTDTTHSGAVETSLQSHLIYISGWWFRGQVCWKARCTGPHQGLAVTLWGSVSRLDRWIILRHQAPLGLQKQNSRHKYARLYGQTSPESFSSDTQKTRASTSSTRTTTIWNQGAVHWTWR